MPTPKDTLQVITQSGPLSPDPKKAPKPPIHPATSQSHPRPHGGRERRKEEDTSVGPWVVSVSIPKIGAVSWTVRFLPRHRANQTGGTDGVGDTKSGTHPPPRPPPPLKQLGRLTLGRRNLHCAWRLVVLLCRLPSRIVQAIRAQHLMWRAQRSDVPRFMSFIIVVYLGELSFFWFCFLFM
ncbi:hypothetical protein BJX96DRAFT_83757 [Aspergillus floccosus]